MTDRLHELRRQRELLKQHLDWIDAEIAAEQAAIPTHVTLSDRPRFASPTTDPAPIADPDALLEKYRAEAKASPTRVKLGCWIAFLAAFVAVWGVVGVWYLLKTR